MCAGGLDRLMPDVEDVHAAYVLAWGGAHSGLFSPEVVAPNR